MQIRSVNLLVCLLCEVYVGEREQLLNGERKLAVHVLFSLGIQIHVHSFLSFSNMYTHCIFPENIFGRDLLSYGKSLFSYV
jgi:hypothetical protein